MIPDTLRLHSGEDAAQAASTTPLLIDINELAKLLSRSRASLERDDAAGRLPAPLKIGHSKRWRLAEITAWVAAGCPPRDRWKHIWAAMQR